MHLFPSKKINGFYGYRTASSMENQHRWVFAQKYSAKLMVALGKFLALFSGLIAFSNLTEFAEMRE